MRVAAVTDGWSVALEQPDDDLVAELWELYRQAFTPLTTRAAARHLLTASEFSEEMADPRIEKYVARGPGGHVVGLTTLTRDLDAVPWISGDLYRDRWPDHAATGRLYYLGYTLAAPDEQRSGVFEAMLDAFADRMAAEGAVMAYDMCGVNVEAGFADACAALFGDRCATPPAVVDTQRYYVAEFGGTARRP